MITSFVLTVSIILSNLVLGTQSQQFSDMSEEDFSDFVDMHADIFDTITEFAAKGIENYHVVAERGVIGVATAIAIKSIAKSGHMGALIAGAAVEVAKGVYSDLRSNASKDDKIEEMSRQMEILLKEVNTLKSMANGNLSPSIGDFSSGHGHETRDRNTGHGDVRTSVYGLAGRTFTTDAREAGPHRDGFREFRDSSTREIRDTIDRITHDALRDRSNDNYVERR